MKTFSSWQIGERILNFFSLFKSTTIETETSIEGRQKILSSAIVAHTFISTVTKNKNEIYVLDELNTRAKKTKTARHRRGPL